jgi:hypothetical protein
MCMKMVRPYIYTYVQERQTEPELHEYWYSRLCVSQYRLLSSVADPDPGSSAFLNSGSGIRDPGWVKNQDPISE